MKYEFDKVPCYYLKLRWAEQISRRFYNERMEGCGITGRQFTLLSFIAAKEGCSLKELADLIMLERSTVNRSVQPLLKYGLLEDKRKAGQRNSSLHLTPKGEQTLKDATVAWDKAQHDFESLFTKKELERLNKSLDILNRLE